jgi:hypothetical protein
VPSAAVTCPSLIVSISLSILRTRAALYAALQHYYAALLRAGCQGVELESHGAKDHCD